MTVRLTGSAAIALVVSSVGFGLLHLVTTADATTLSVLSTTLGGVMYGLAYLRTGRIWMGVGIHFAWNFVQGTVLVYGLGVLVINTLVDVALAVLDPRSTIGEL